MTIQEYLITIDKEFKKGISGEHSYRGYLQELILGLVNGIEVTNEPKGVADCGNPDYVITNKKQIPVGYIEAKDIGKDLNSKEFKEQFTRYKKGLDNLIITDYTWFQFFKNGELVHEIRIGEIHENCIKPITSNFDRFENLINDFCMFIGQQIKSSKKLAEMMAAKARLLQNILEKAVTTDEESQENTSIKNQYDTFKEILIHDLEPKEFADIYAQTLAYGMFAARLHDKTPDSFSRQEAANLIPKSNPFLRKLFHHVAGYDIDDRIKTTVDNLAEVFRATDVDALLHNFGKSTQANDPIIHFYETFLSEYDPKLRKSRGVWYTPEPVVNFIVRAVDDILKSEFGLKDGLADTSKTKIKIKTQTVDKRIKGGHKIDEKEVHKVQILDPATGTGTFLAEVVKQVYNKHFKSIQGAWSSYVENDLIPRLNGFEILMASYSMAHLKLDMLLSETGYKPTKDQRFNIYLTDSLEEHHPDTGTLFMAQWLSEEANEANHIKRDTPVMCVIGNPPYSGISSNNGKWISSLIEDYKYVDGVHFKERKHWLNDDYVKFIRYGQYFIEKNGEGVLAYISPHGFLDNPTFRGMRWHLLKTYDKIFTIDLHGNSKKKEVSPDGTKDENVFDIQQGVAITLFVKTGKKKKNELGKVFHFDLFGSRENKYKFLSTSSLNKVEFKQLKPNKPNIFFVQKNEIGKELYEKGFRIDNLFSLKNSGVVTGIDRLSIFKTEKELIETTTKIIESENPYTEFNIKDTRRISKEERIQDLIKAKSKGIVKINYRPFDTNFMYLPEKNEHWINSPRIDVMKHFLKGKNVGLNYIRPMSSSYEFSIFISQYITDQCSAGNKSAGAGISSIAPLYIYLDSDNKLENKERTPNLNLEIIGKIAKDLKLTFTNEKEETENVFAPIDILDYIYAVLHSSTYREKYKEFLKIDFPRVPYPKDKDTFWKLVKLGKEIRQIHLLESAKVEEFITSYPIDIQDKIKRNRILNKLNKKDWEIIDADKQLGRIWINDEQYFDNVPEVAWNFYIGGYQPAQKWLKDRKGRELTYEDIKHYQKIIVALTETGRLMKEIDKVGVE